MQAQIPNSPYIGLWTRLAVFHTDDLARLLTKRRVVRVTLMRGTIHLVTARDCLALRPLVQPVLERGLKGSFGRQLAGMDTRAIAAAGRALLEEQPRTGAALGGLLQKRWPDRDARSLAYAVQYLEALVQVPPRGVWGASAPATWTTVESWLDHRLASKPSPDRMLLRYLAAFGPATVADMRAWSGLPGLREVAERLRPQLRTFQNDHGLELFDLPRAPRPHPDTPAPPRFLPFYENALLSYADRSRFIPPGRGGHGFTSEGLLVGTVLIDGFVGARWRVSRDRGRALLRIEPFARLRKQDRDALAGEGERLLAFAADDVQARDVRFGPPLK